MTSPDRTILLDRLDRASQALRDAVADLTEEQASTKPAGCEWSVADCVEHIAVTEAGLLRLVSKTSAPLPEGTETENRDPLFLRGGTNRRRAVQAPHDVRPSGRYASLAESIGGFFENRRRSREWIEQCPHDLRRFAVAHPVAGNITAHECCILLALHPERHAAQIREIRERLSGAATSHSKELE
jgi:hypothetical protein